MTARRRRFEETVLACLLGAGVSVQSLAATTPAPFDPRDDPVSAAIAAESGVRAPEQPRTGNPLWGVPLRSLNVTRDRPIFVPSRRPAAPAVPAASAATSNPPPSSQPPEPERPGLSLVGIVTASGEGFAVFINNATRDTVRLRTGEGHDGWILRSVQSREAVLEKNSRTAIFELPSPGDRK